MRETHLRAVGAGIASYDAARMFRCFLAAMFLLALFALSPPAAAQTGSGLMLDPFRTSDYLEANAHGMFQTGSETDNLGSQGAPFDFRADIYDLTGRLRVTPVGD